MKPARKSNILFTTIIIAICLFSPIPGAPGSLFATHLPVYLQIQQINPVQSEGRCDDCPCSRGYDDSGCCYASNHGCSCHLTLPASMPDSYAPSVLMAAFIEPTGRLPDVYRRIFVPPQNSACCLSKTVFS